jgi:hypothetical protein
VGQGERRRENGEGKMEKGDLKPEMETGNGSK